jgi:ADP-heptose:LPS heptosyltransferase
MRKKIIITTRGGIGDVLLCTPALRALKECNPDHKIIVYCFRKDHREALLHNPNIDSLRLLAPLYLWRYPFHLYCYLTRSHRHGHFFNSRKLKYYRLLFGHVSVSWIYQKSIKEIVPEIFSDLPIRLQHKNIQIFFTAKEEARARRRLAPYTNVVIMHIYSRSSQNHMWPMERWNTLVRKLPEFTFIQVGKTTEPQVKGAIDWRNDQMSIREIFCILKYCTSFVGVDSCVAHATNAFNLPGVVLYGDNSPVHWGHENNINIYKAVRCSPCNDLVEPSPCPYHHECMNLITVEEVQKALIAQVKLNNPSRISPNGTSRVALA